MNCKQIPYLEQIIPVSSPIEPNFIQLVSEGNFDNNPLIYNNNEYQLLYDNNIN